MQRRFVVGPKRGDSIIAQVAGHVGTEGGDAGGFIVVKIKGFQRFVDLGPGLPGRTHRVRDLLPCILNLKLGCAKIIIR